MAVSVISGKLGSGKSFDCVRRVVEHLRLGGCVRTNIRLDYKQIAKAVGRTLSPFQIGTLSADDEPSCIPTGDRRGHGSRRTIVLLDEALNWFQSEASSNKDEKKKKWGEWLRQSDKLGQDVWFISQNFERSAKWIRELAQISVEIVPLKDVKVAWFIPIWLIFPPARRMYVAKWRDVRSGTIIKMEFHRYSPFVWNLYDTSETFGFVGAASAYDSVRLWPRFKNPSLFVAVDSLVVALCVGVIGFISVF